MAVAEQLQKDINGLRSLIDSILDEGVTSGAELTSAAALLTEAKRQLASLNRADGLLEIFREGA